MKTRISSAAPQILFAYNGYFLGVYLNRLIACSSLMFFFLNQAFTNRGPQLKNCSQISPLEI